MIHGSEDHGVWACDITECLMHLFMAVYTDLNLNSSLTQINRNQNIQNDYAAFTIKAAAKNRQPQNRKC